MSGTYSDAHGHFSGLQNESEIADFIQNCADQNVGCFLVGGYDPREWKAQIELARVLAKSNSPLRLFKSFGLHPWAVNKLTSQECSSALSDLRRYLEGENLGDRPQAVGECGLDFAHRVTDQQKTQQKLVFREQCELAAEFRLPAVIHSVGAFEATAEIIAEYSGKLRAIQLHGFSGDKGQVARYLKLGPSGGVYFSIGPSRGKAGEKAADSLAIKSIPAEFLLVESDSNDSPELLLRVARDVAAIRGESWEKVLERNTENLMVFLDQ